MRSVDVNLSTTLAVKIKAWLYILYENALKASVIKILVFIFMYPEKVFLDLNLFTSFV